MGVALYLLGLLSVGTPYSIGIGFSESIYALTHANSRLMTQVYTSHTDEMRAGVFRN